MKAEISHGWICSPAGEMAHPIALEIVEYPQSQCLDSLKGLLQPEWTETSVSPSWNSFKESEEDCQKEDRPRIKSPWDQDDIPVGRTESSAESAFHVVKMNP